jgi:hypothetical protein
MSNGAGVEKKFLSPIGLVFGQVNDRRDGIADVEVKLFRADAEVGSQSTDGRGFYEFRNLEPGQFEVRLPRKVKNVSSKPCELPDVPEGKEKRIPFVLAEGQPQRLADVSYQEEAHIIERQVVLANDVPAEGRLVEVRRSKESHSVVRSGRTGKDGFVRLDVEKAGKYHVWVYPDPQAQAAPLVEENVEVKSVNRNKVVVPSPAPGAAPPSPRLEPPRGQRRGVTPADEGQAGDVIEAVEDISAYPMLTEEVGYPPSPLARPAGMPAPIQGTSALGQTAMKAISEVLGWQVKPDPKAFIGALNASFSLKEVEGHTEATWTPRTYAVQTDLSGGVTGAQASVYTRAKEALDQSLPLLDGLYVLDVEAKPEDITALRATVRSQFVDLVNEFGLLGGPRIARVTQLFSLLLGQQFTQATDPVETDPDKILGSLGILRDEFGLSTAADLVNTVKDEQNVTNFRIVSDYLTSLAQTWLNNLKFFGLNGKTPFFGTQLVLLQRQLSVVAEKTNEVRFTLDSVFIGPADRQTLQIDFNAKVPGSPPPMFLEDLFIWIDSFASEEGPRLIAEGGKFAVGTAFLQIAKQLQQLVRGLEVNGPTPPQHPRALPPGFKTFRVQKSVKDLADALNQLVTLAQPISHLITPEPERPLAVLSITPNVVFRSAWPRTTDQKAQPVTITINGAGFDAKGTTGTIQDTSPSTRLRRLQFGGPKPGTVTIHSDSLAVATLMPDDNGIPPQADSYSLTITMKNSYGAISTLVTVFTILDNS